MTLVAYSPLDNSYGARHALDGLQLSDVRLAEDAELGAVMCNAAVDAATIHKATANAIGCELPLQHGATVSVGRRQAIWMSPRSWLVLCPPEEESEIVAALHEAFPDHLVSGAPYSDYLCWFSLEGSGVEAALRQGSFLSFDERGIPVAHGKRTLIAGIPAVLLRDGEQNWRVGVERSRAGYFLGWLQSLTSEGVSR